MDSAERSGSLEPSKARSRSWSDRVLWGVRPALGGVPDEAGFLGGAASGFGVLQA